MFDNIPERSLEPPNEPRRLTDSASNAMAHDWVRGLDEGSKEWRAFLTFCYKHFGNQMDVLAVAFVQTDGEETFEAYLESCEQGATDSEWED